jgi:pimeloyl-ACP methyl ester carboxylesterase
LTQQPAPFFREVGAGPGVVCLHSNASTSAQWRDLVELLESEFHVLAADSYGAGRSPDWPSDRRVSLRDESELLDPVFKRAGDPFALVGHSYGGAVALKFAVEHPERVSALALYEPTLFAVIEEASPPPNDADGIKAAVSSAAAALDVGDNDTAAEVFIDFWMGAGSWAATRPAVKPFIAAAMTNVRGWADALINEPTPLEAFRRLDMPVLYIVGSESPASSRGVGRLLTGVLPRVQVLELEGLGHMGPITHSRIVNNAIASFLRHEVTRMSWVR